MRYNLGDTVLFAKNYHDSAREGVLVRPEGTFYIGVTPPTGVNYVVGSIEPRPGDFRFPLFSYFMNFKKEDVWACDNKGEVNEKVFKNIEASAKRSYGTIELDSAEEARVLYRAFRKEGIDCILDGTSLVNISNMTKANKIYDAFLSRHVEQAKGSLNLNYRPKMEEKGEIDMHFEI